MAQELKKRTFPKAMLGYNTDEVEKYLDNIITRYNTLAKENDDLKRRLAEAKQENEHLTLSMASVEDEIHEKAESILKSAGEEQSRIISEAHVRAEEIIRIAKKEAEEIKSDAENIKTEAESIKAEAETKLNDAECEAENIKSSAEKTKKKIYSEIGEYSAKMKQTYSDFMLAVAGIESMVGDDRPEIDLDIISDDISESIDVITDINTDNDTDEPEIEVEYIIEDADETEPDINIDIDTEIQDEDNSENNENAESVDEDIDSELIRIDWSQRKKSADTGTIELIDDIVDDKPIDNDDETEIDLGFSFEPDVNIGTDEEVEEYIDFGEASGEVYKEISDSEITENAESDFNEPENAEEYEEEINLDGLITDIGNPQDGDFTVEDEIIEDDSIVFEDGENKDEVIEDEIIEDEDFSLDDISSSEDFNKGDETIEDSDYINLDSLFKSDKKGSAADFSATDEFNLVYSKDKGSKSVAEISRQPLITADTPTNPKKHK